MSLLPHHSRLCHSQAREGRGPSPRGCVEGAGESGGGRKEKAPGTGGHFLCAYLPPPLPRPTSGSHSGPKASSSYGAKGAPGRSERGSPPPLPTSGGCAKAGVARVSGGTAHLLPNLHGSSFFDMLQLHIFFAAELCRNSFKHRRAQVLTLNGNSGAPTRASRAGGSDPPARTRRPRWPSPSAPRPPPPGATLTRAALGPPDLPQEQDHG